MKLHGRTGPSIFLLAMAILASHGAFCDLSMPSLSQPGLLINDPECHVAVRSATEKTLPGEDLSGTASLEAVELACARNETEQFSLIVWSDTDITSVALEFPQSNDANTLPAGVWDWKRVATVPVAKPSVWYGLGGWQTGDIPDPLLPGEPFDLKAAQKVSLLVTVSIPADTEPGRYLSTISLRWAGQIRRQIPVKVEVWDIVLPESPELDTIVCGAQLSDPEYCAFLRESGVTGLKYGSTRLQFEGKSTPDALSLTLDAYETDLRVLLDEMGFRWVCLPPSLLGSQRNLSESYIGSGIKVGTEAFWPLHGRYLGLMADFYRTHGWQDRVLYYMMDEIQPELLETAEAVANQAEEVYPEIVTCLTTHEMPDSLANALDVWCVPWHFFVTRSEDVHRWDELRSGGLRLWNYMNSAYTLNASWNPGALRLYPVITAKYGYEGILWWHLRYYKGQDPWKAGIATLTDDKRDRRHYANGYMVYPPRNAHDGWHSSLRWENYRQGIEEYGLMMELNRRLERVRAELGPLAKDPAFSPDQAMRWWGSMLAREFRVQTFRHDAAYIHRFRQLLSHEILNLEAAPLAIIDCEPDEAWGMTSDTLHLRGLCAPGTHVDVDGVVVSDFDAENPFVFVANVALEAGRNEILIRLSGPGDPEKVLYREVFRSHPDAP